MKIRFNKIDSGAAASQAGSSSLAGFVGFPASRQPQTGNRRSARRCEGLTLEEVEVSMASSAFPIGKVATGYVTAAEWAALAAYSAVARPVALQEVEEARAVIWDELPCPPRTKR